MNTILLSQNNIVEVEADTSGLAIGRRRLGSTNKARNTLSAGTRFYTQRFAILS